MFNDARELGLDGFCGLTGTDGRRRTLSRKRLGVAVVLLGLLVVVPSSFAAEPIAVGVVGGQVFSGLVDARTDDAWLYLRTERTGIALRRPIAWDDILLAQVGEKQISSEELRAQIDTLKVADPAERVASDAAKMGGANQINQDASAAGSAEELPAPRLKTWNPDTRMANYIAAARANNTQVCSISIDANVGHFSRTVEASGIVLHLFPLDGWGRMVPVDATLDVELIAGLSYVPPVGTSLPRIGHWSVRVTPDQFGPGGAVIKLPFRAVQPEFNLGVGPYGLVHARLSVPGAGSFEASQSMLRIRPYSAVRDQQQQINGQRFFDVESVNRRGD